MSWTIQFREGAHDDLLRAGSQVQKAYKKTVAKRLMTDPINAYAVNEGEAWILPSTTMSLNSSFNRSMMLSGIGRVKRRMVSPSK